MLPSAPDSRPAVRAGAHLRRVLSAGGELATDSRAPDGRTRSVGGVRLRHLLAGPRQVDEVAVLVVGRAAGGVLEQQGNAAGRGAVRRSASRCLAGRLECLRLGAEVRANVISGAGVQM